MTTRHHERDEATRTDLRRQLGILAARLDSLTADVMTDPAVAPISADDEDAYEAAAARHESGIGILDLIAGCAEDFRTAQATAVAVARAEGYSWTEVARALGVTRQAAQQRYGDTIAATLRELAADTEPAELVPDDEHQEQRGTGTGQPEALSVLAARPSVTELDPLATVRGWYDGRPGVEVAGEWLHGHTPAGWIVRQRLTGQEGWTEHGPYDDEPTAIAAKTRLMRGEGA